MASEKSKEKDLISDLRKNPWIVASVVLAVTIVALLVLNASSSCSTGQVISKQAAGDKLVNFLNSQVPQGEVTLNSVEEEAGLYQVMVSYQGRKIPMYMTKDGENMVQGVQPISGQATQNTNQQQNQEQADIPKSDKPEVGLYVMSFCPYGNQAEKTMEPVYELLKDKVNFNVNYIVNVQGDSVGSLHGQSEVNEDMREACVLENNGLDKWFDFATYVNDNCGSSGSCWEEAASEAGLNVDNINSCVENRGLELMKDSQQASNEAGASGSPTLLINGQKSRAVYQYGNSQAYLDAICSAFNEKPSECDQQLGSSSSTTTSGGSC